MLGLVKDACLLGVLYMPIREVALCTMIRWQRQSAGLPLCRVHVCLGASTALQVTW